MLLEHLLRLRSVFPDMIHVALVKPHRKAPGVEWKLIMN